MIEHCEAVIKSIELQLVRVETCGCAEGYSRDGGNGMISHKANKPRQLGCGKKIKIYRDISFTATEIQNIQIGEGNACANLAIPIYMIFPRLFTCPTLSTSNFKVGKRRSFLQIVSERTSQFEFRKREPRELINLMRAILFSEFEVNLIVVFEDDYLVTENFPIILTRY